VAPEFIRPEIVATQTASEATYTFRRDEVIRRLYEETETHKFRSLIQLRIEEVIRLDDALSSLSERAPQHRSSDENEFLDSIV
jgi:hypothetical protein